MCRRGQALDRGASSVSDSRDPEHRQPSTITDQLAALSLHSAPMALTPLIIRWGADASSDVLRMLGVVVYAIPSVGARRFSILTGLYRRSAGLRSQPLCNAWSAVR